MAETTTDALDNPTTLDDLALAAATLVQPLFQHHGWTWRIAPGQPLRVPTVAEIAEKMRDCLRYAEYGFVGTSGSGRLLVVHERDRDTDARTIRACLDLGVIYPDERPA